MRQGPAEQRENNVYSAPVWPTAAKRISVEAHSPAAASSSVAAVARKVTSDKFAVRATLNPSCLEEMTTKSCGSA